MLFCNVDYIIVFGEVRIEAGECGRARRVVKRVSQSLAHCYIITSSRKRRGHWTLLRLRRRLLDIHIFLRLERQSYTSVLLQHVLTPAGRFDANAATVRGGKTKEVALAATGRDRDIKVPVGRRHVTSACTVRWECAGAAWQGAPPADIGRRQVRAAATVGCRSTLILILNRDSLQTTNRLVGWAGCKVEYWWWTEGELQRRPWRQRQCKWMEHN